MLKCRKVINYYEKHPDEKRFYLNELSYIRKNFSFNMIPGPISEYNNLSRINVVSDLCNNLFYVIHNGKKLYFPGSYSEIMVKESYRTLTIEQNAESPHLYFDESVMIMAEDIFVDVGSGEGISSLDMIDHVKEIVIFEGDSMWFDALRATFTPWSNKVTVINKYVSDITDRDGVTLDSYFQEKKQNLLIKIDVEGMERKVLKGAEKILSETNNRIVCCTYHNQDDAEDFKKYFNDKGYETSFSSGFMLLLNDKTFIPPFFRKGVIRAWHNN